MSEKRVKGSMKKNCRRCKNDKAVIRKYGLYICRRCFKEVALKIGFNKLD